jgi:CO/xanthine dehydrogenase FAD-binding subunit
MKAADFLYHRPRSVKQAVQLLSEYGGTARILSGGQSLMPMMNLRLWRPAALIDIGSVTELDTIEVKGEETVLGARFGYSRIETDPMIAKRLPLLARMIRSVGDRQVRNRGTIGGALVQADPTGEMALGTLILGATIHVQGKKEKREIAAEDFFLGSYATAIDPEEILVSVTYPRHPDHFAFAEINRRHNDFAVVSVALAGDVDAFGRWHRLRIGLGGVDETPVLARRAMEAGQGTTLDADTIAAMAAIAAEDITPPNDIRASAEYRRHLTRVYLTRMLTSLASDAATPKAGRLEK